MRLRSASTLGAILALACAFSAGSRAHTTIPRVEPTPTIDCQSRLQVIPDRNFPPPFRGRGYAAAGPVHLTAWFRDEPRSQFRPEGGNAMKRIKAPVFVEAGPAVTVELVGKSAMRAEIEIGLDQGASARSSSVRFVPCPPDATVAERRVGRHTPFIGGYRISGPMCMELSVLPDGTADPIRKRLAFGRGSCRRRA